MNIAVFCSARESIADEYTAHARALGEFIGRNHLTLVYGGIELGLMEVTAQAVKHAGGNVLGVVPEARKDRQSKCLDSAIYTDSLHDRKKIMQREADIFVILAGGFGTLDELMSVWADMTFYAIEKPILIDNARGLYNPLKEQLQLMVTEHLLSPDVLSRLHFFDDFSELLNEIRK